VFATVRREKVVVRVGQSAALTVTMQLSSVSATVTVSGAIPVIDTRESTPAPW
jgi:hypothetical protein